MVHISLLSTKIFIILVLNLKKIYKDLMTIIIPRHISRSHEINKLCNNYKLSSQILNDRELIEEKNEIIIINSF